MQSQRGWAPGLANGLERTVAGLKVTWMWNSPTPLVARNHWSVGLFASKAGKNLPSANVSSRLRSRAERWSVDALDTAEE